MTTSFNGVDVSKVMAQIEAVRKDPAAGTFKFTVSSVWNSGLSARHASTEFVLGADKHHHLAKHEITTDLPECFAGTDGAMSPIEMLLSSLGACLATSYALHGAAMGIKLQSLAVEVKGEGDLAGFFGVGNCKPGLTEISVSTTIKSTASRERLEDLHRFVTTHSPVWDTIASRVHVDGKLVTDEEVDGAIEL
jgi:uncharacterized OsmC-like protein